MIIISEEVREFILQLEKTASAKCSRIVKLLERFQHNLKMPHSKSIGQNLFELRIRGKHEIRIIYTFQQGQIILFYAFIKKSQSIPQQEMHKIYDKFRDLHT